MRAATTQISIAPRGTFWMEGYNHPIREQPGLGVHDTPYAILVLVEQGAEQILFVSLDVCMVREDMTRAMREGLATQLGIPADHIVINAIHSHSCVNGFEGPGGIITKKTPGYVEMVTGEVLAAATKLPDAMVEVSAELLKTHVDGWYSNRNDKNLPFDDEAFVLRFVDSDGTAVAALLNFNCHATVLSPLNRLVTSDVIGGARAELAEWIGVTPLTFTGASGNLGNRQFRQGNDFRELRRISNGIAGEIMKASFEAQELAAPSVRSFSYEVHYNNEDFYPEYQRQLDEVEAMLARPDITFDEQKLAGTEKPMLEKKLTIHDVHFWVNMAVVDFGELVFVTFPGELASEFGQRIKGMFGERTVIVMGYTNDYQGYFVPTDTFGGTSYESYVTQMPKGGTEKLLDAFEAWL